MCTYVCHVYIRVVMYMVEVHSQQDMGASYLIGRASARAIGVSGQRNAKSFPVVHVRRHGGKTQFLVIACVES